MFHGATTAANYCGEGSGENFRANVSTFYDSDEVLNTEIGIKTLLADGAMRLNATAYQIGGLIFRYLNLIQLIYPC